MGELNIYGPNFMLGPRFTNNVIPNKNFSYLLENGVYLNSLISNGNWNIFSHGLANIYNNYFDVDKIIFKGTGNSYSDYVYYGIYSSNVFDCHNIGKLYIKIKDCFITTGISETKHESLNSTISLKSSQQQYAQIFNIPIGESNIEFNVSGLNSCYIEIKLQVNDLEEHVAQYVNLFIEDIQVFYGL